MFKPNALGAVITALAVGVAAAQTPATTESGNRLGQQGPGTTEGGRGTPQGAPTPNTYTQPATGRMRNLPQAAPGASIPLNPQTPLMAEGASVLRDAATTAALQLEAAQLASQRSRSPATRRLATSMTAAYARVRQSLQQISGARSADLPTAPDAAGRGTLDQLGRLEGTQFDQAYAQAASKSDRALLTRLEDAARSSGQDPRVRAFAQSHLADLQGSLRLAEQLATPRG